MDNNLFMGFFRFDRQSDGRPRIIEPVPINPSRVSRLLNAVEPSPVDEHMWVSHAPAVQPQMHSIYIGTTAWTANTAGSAATQQVPITAGHMPSPYHPVSPGRRQPEAEQAQVASHWARDEGNESPTYAPDSPLMYATPRHIIDSTLESPATRTEEPEARQQGPACLGSGFQTPRREEYLPPALEPCFRPTFPAYCLDGWRGQVETYRPPYVPQSSDMDAWREQVDGGEGLLQLLERAERRFEVAQNHMDQAMEVFTEARADLEEIRRAFGR